MSGKFKNLRFALVAATLTMSANGFAQTVIKGNVTDNTGEPIIGASVIEQGTNTGGVTDLDGNFTITLTGNSKKLKISYVGMKPQLVNVAGKSTINVKLEDDSNSLNDVVVIGYGAVKKKDLTGAVATVDNKALTQVPVASASEALTGKMPGVQITTTEGSPDADVKIRVRGGGSITQSNDPLYIVDGFPVETISDIPASDIEDITVLKDASSTAIYGSRGANGVILVTTKGGKEGKTSVSYNAYYSWKKIAKKLDVLGARDYTEWQYELANLLDKTDNYEKYFGSYDDIDLYDNVATNDWQDIVYGRTGHTFNQNLNINGGSDKIKYAFSYARMDDKAIMQMSDFVRDNLSLKLNAKPTKRVSLDFQARWSKTKINGGGANEQSSTYNTDKRLRYAIQYTPYPVPGLSTDTDDDDTTNSSFYNPVTSLKDNDQKRTRITFNMSGAFTWELYKNLKFKTEFGYDTYKVDTKRFYGPTTYYVKNVPASANQGKPAITLTNQYRTKFRNTNTISYDFKDIFGKNSDHSLNVLLGEEYIVMKNELMTNTAHGFPANFTSAEAWKFTTQGTPFEINDFYDPDDILNSYFGRINYNYKEKYLLSATARADGSSKFAKGNRWGFFPSIAAAWRISSEPFMKGAEKWLDDLKLRLSYGTAGNNNISSGLLTQEFQANATSWINGYNSYISPSKTMANPDLKWETTITRNVGIDYTMFGSKLTGSIDAYWNNTKDLLIQYPVAGTGYDYQYRNMGETRNMGLEFALTWNAINKKNFGLTVGANISFNKNKVLSLGQIESIDNISTQWASSEIDQDFVIKKGEPIGQIWGYKSAGRYEVDDFDIAKSQEKGKWILKDGVADCSTVLGTSVRPGSMKLAEIKENKTGTITTADRTVIGDTNPAHTGGFNINARVYGFDLTANFNWSVGNDVYNANAIEYTQTSKYQYRNLIDRMAMGSRWTNIDANGNLLNWNNAEELAALNANTTMWSPYTGKYVLTDYYVEDASFLRLSTLTLGYTLPTTLTKRVGINSLRFYVTAYNVFCLTNYSGFDPEVSAIRRTNLTPGVDYSAYPKSRQFVIGLNLNF
uniref:SusC/RagA family TonB-linked outer membrane protein n=1 Tax=Prevotella sp. TaxID=59823 RepID=UPI0025E9D420|nr:TonB-dependent receptor [uncultured Prevotella sp.]